MFNPSNKTKEKIANCLEHPVTKVTLPLVVGGTYAFLGEAAAKAATAAAGCDPVTQKLQAQ